MSEKIVTNITRRGFFALGTTSVISSLWAGHPSYRRARLSPGGASENRPTPAQDKMWEKRMQRIQRNLDLIADKQARTRDQLKELDTALSRLKALHIVQL